MVARYVWPLVLGLCFGCAPAASTPAAATPAKVSASPDTTGLAYLFPTETAASATTRATSEAFRGVLAGAGYTIVKDPRTRYDAEIVLRVAVSGSEIALPSIPSGRTVDASERVHLTVSVVSEHRVIDTVRTDFFATNGQAAASDVVPAADAMGRSPKLLAFGVKVRERHEARAEEAVRTASASSR